MLRKIVWCYILVLSLVDITVKTKLSAHGKSHDAASSNGHDTLSDAYSFTEEWMDGTTLDSPTDKLPKTFVLNKEASEMLIQLDPPCLCLQLSYLGEAVRTTVTLTNLGQDTLHLASLAGDKPDFHASFFEHKMVSAGANTSFSIVYIGREVGQSAGVVYIRTSRGVLRYKVLSQTWPPMWGMWPVDLNVPYNATVRADVVVTNPTTHTVQVTDMYSSSPWLGLQLLDGAYTTSKEQWMIPAGATRTIARLAPSLHAGGQGAVHSAWVRVRGQHMPRHALLAVTARQVPAGIYVQPEQIRIRVTGSYGPNAQIMLHVGNSAPVPATIDRVTVTSRCLPQPLHPNNATASSAPGVSLQILKSVIDPHSPPQPAVEVTFNYPAMWSAYYMEHRHSNAFEWEKQAYCGGYITVEGATLPYSVSVLAGGAVLPTHIHVVRSAPDVHRSRKLRVRNEMPQELRLVQLEAGPNILTYFHMKDLTGGVVRVGEDVSFAELTLKPDAPTEVLDSWIALHTNVSRYVVSVASYSGQLNVWWDWPVWEPEGPLLLGTLPVSSTKRVRGTLTSNAPRQICLRGLKAHLPGASLTLSACALLTSVPADHECMCIEPYGEAAMVLTIVAPARPGTVHGSIAIETLHLNATIPVTVTASEGRVRARSLRFTKAAPYVHSEASLVLESNLKCSMQVIQVSQPAHRRDTNVIYKGVVRDEAGPSVGRVVYAMERQCEPHCYTGLPHHTEPAIQWMERAANAVTDPIGVITEDLILLDERYKQFKPEPQNLTLYVQTTEVISIPCHATVTPYWPRIAAPPGPPALASVGGRSGIVVEVTNPSDTHPMLVQPFIAATREHYHVSGLSIPGWCKVNKCVSRPNAFRFIKWHSEGGGVTEHAGGAAGAPLLLLPPRAKVELTLLFNPHEQSAMTATLYLRNNLTVVEPLAVYGRGCVPKLHVSPQPALVFETLECVRTATRRVLTARNAGSVPLSLHGWLINGHSCRGRGFAVEPCGPMMLQPNASLTFTLIYAPDYSLATVYANLTVRTDTAEMWFPLTARTPATVLARCNQTPPRPPWEQPLRSAGTMIAAAAVALVLAAGALDADRVMRTAHASRGEGEPPRPPLDLRAVAAEPPPPLAPPLPPPLPPLPRRKRRKHDPAAEGRAFDAWRLSLHAGHNADRCSEPTPSPPYESLECRDSPDDESTSSSDISSTPADQDQENEDQEDQDHESLNTSDEGNTQQEQSATHPVRAESPPPPYSAVSESPTRRRRDRRGKDERTTRPARRTRPTQPKRRAAPTATLHSAICSVTPPVVSDTGSSGSNTSARYTSWSSVVVGGGAAPSRAPPQPPPPELAPVARPRTRRHDSLFYFNGTQDRFNWPDCQTVSYDSGHSTYDNVAVQSPDKNSPYEHVSRRTPPYEHVSRQTPTYDHVSRQTPPYEHKSGQTPPYEHKSGQTPPYVHKSGQTQPYEQKSGQTQPYEQKSGQTPPYEHKSPPYEHCTGQTPPYDNITVKPSPSKSTGNVTPDLRPLAARTTGNVTPDLRPFAARTQHPEESCIKTPIPIHAVGHVQTSVGVVGHVQPSVGAVGQPSNTGHMGTFGNVTTMVNTNNNLGNMGNHTTNVSTMGNVSNVGKLGNIIVTNTSVGSLSNLGNVPNYGPAHGAHTGVTNVGQGISLTNSGIGNMNSGGNVNNVGNMNTIGNPNNVGNMNTIGNMNVVGNIGAIGSGYTSWGGLEARAPGAGWGYMRPPPGFAPPTSQPPAAPARPYDPFQSLAAIWTRTALDWGAEDVHDQQQ